MLLRVSAEMRAESIEHVKQKTKSNLGDSYCYFHATNLCKTIADLGVERNLNLNQTFSGEANLFGPLMAMNQSIN